MKVDHDQFIPVLFWGYGVVDGKTVIYQLWTTPLGQQEWRPLPMVKMKDERKPSIAGYLEGDDEDH